VDREVGYAQGAMEVSKAALPPLAEAQATLERATSSLVDALSTLEDRLRPVTIDAPPANAKEQVSQVQPVRSAAVAALHAEAATLRTQAVRVRNLISRLDV
jgi:hypothetical protein